MGVKILRIKPRGALEKEGWEAFTADMLHRRGLGHLIDVKDCGLLLDVTLYSGWGSGVLTYAGPEGLKFPLYVPEAGVEWVAQASGYGYADTQYELNKQLDILEQRIRAYETSCKCDVYRLMREGCPSARGAKCVSL